MPLIQVCVMIFRSVYLFLGFLVDIAGILFNPRRGHH
ncbi:ABC-type dipeptide/oligopeptide/nickel transport system permease component [Bradyrhizobium sp. JR1.5]